MSQLNAFCWHLVGGGPGCWEEPAVPWTPRDPGVHPKGEQCRPVGSRAWPIILSPPPASPPRHLLPSVLGWTADEVLSLSVCLVVRLSCSPHVHSRCPVTVFLSEGIGTCDEGFFPYGNLIVHLQFIQIRLMRQNGIWLHYKCCCPAVV